MSALTKLLASPTAILRVGDSLKMFRVHTESVAAQMVDLKAIRYLAYETVVDDPVDVSVLLRLDPDDSVASSGRRALPNKAAVLVNDNSGHEALDDRHQRTHSMSAGSKPTRVL